MNWKEELEDYWHKVLKHDNGCANAENFISTEIIEKLIEDLPEIISAEVGWSVKTPKLKQQLRDKWLGIKPDCIRCNDNGCPACEGTTWNIKE